MQCLIPAAGLGSRLNTLGPSKPLVNLAGRALFAHVLDGLRQAGCDEFVVVTGHRATEVEDFLGNYVADNHVRIKSVHNPEFEKPNGLSLLSARELLRPTFLISMSDHLIDPAIADDLSRQPVADGEVVLAVDRRLQNADVDMDDVTKVRTHGDLIVDIGKNIVEHNAFDTGLFLATSGLLDAIREARDSGEEPSISAGMMRLAVKGAATAFDIGDRYWIDIDSEDMLARAETRLRG